jgi:hypothetical protein
MGIETTKALQASRRESAAHMERLIARADERRSIGSVRRAPDQGGRPSRPPQGQGLGCRSVVGDGDRG